MKDIIYNVLVVDDEPDITEIISAILERAGIACQTFNDSELALKAIGSGAFTAVLSDISMPKINGIEMMKRVRASGNGVPFVFLTAHGEIDYVKDALKLGALDYIQKPFQSKDVVAVISRAMEIGYRLIKIKSGESVDQIEKDLKFIEKLKVSRS
jgi:DNA-binding NtrC family response regulator